MTPDPSIAYPSRTAAHRDLARTKMRQLYAKLEADWGASRVVKERIHPMDYARCTNAHAALRLVLDDPESTEQETTMAFAELEAAWQCAENAALDTIVAKLKKYGGRWKEVDPGTLALARRHGLLTPFQRGDDNGNTRGRTLR